MLLFNVFVLANYKDKKYLLKNEFMHFLKVCFSIIVLSITSFLYSQSIKRYSHNSLAEKIYLQLDNDVYTTNKTIWFKAVIANAVAHETLLSSGVLYVDLISAEEKVIESKIIKISEGIGRGYFDLNTGFKEGLYQIRAYTEWNRNFEADFVFKKYIQIFSAEEPKNSNVILENLRLIDTLEGSTRFKIDIYPKRFDNNDKNDLKVTVSFDKEQETVQLKKGKNNKYLLDYTLPAINSLINLKLQTQNGLSYTTSFSVNPNYLEVQFFPEGGDLIDQLSCKVGLKATGFNGFGKYVEGDIVDENNNLVSTFKSNRLGMGNFILNEIDISKTYHAIVRDSLKTILKKIPLPKVIKSGYSLEVNSDDKNIFVGVRLNKQNPKTVILKGATRGYEYFVENKNLINGECSYIIAKDKFPEGVIAFTVLDDFNKPVSERLFFNTREENRIDLSINLDKLSYKQRDQVNLTIENNHNSDANNLSTSILVLDKDSSGELQYSRENLLSYFLLSSDLKGHIESPGSYFRDNIDLDIDDLMLTQGWRKYKYRKPLDKLNYTLEKSLEVKGVVSVNNSKLEKEEVDILLMVFDRKPITYAKTIVSPGSFRFRLEDMYGDYKEFLTKSLTDFKKKNKKVKIAISKKQQLPISFDFKNRDIGIKDSLIEKVVKANQFQKYRQDKYYKDYYGVTKLDEVVVDAYKLTPEREKVNKKYGKPNIVIDGKDIQEKEPKWSNGLYSALRHGFQDKIIIRRSPNGNFYAEDPSQRTLVVVDGIPVKEQDLDLVQYIRSDEITSFEIINNARNFKALIAEVYSTFPPYGITDGCVLAIYTNSKKGLFGALKSTKKVEIQSIPVFATNKEFYAPIHNVINKIDWSNPDLRSPLFWKPEIKFNQKGIATLSFYNSDKTGDFLIILETISNTGKIGYKEITYNVITNDFND
ncbi:hypothetical protein [Winogradskyella sp. PE311]|uniref:hypothetical protein n=1 Tax=Winogradskyella sp. PE311 TaxID=3366943 RepID=UPI00397EE45B